MKKDGKNIEGGECMKGKDGRLDFSEKDRKRIWKNHMEEIINKKNKRPRDRSWYGRGTY